MKNFIINLLELKPEDIENLDIIDKDNQVFIYITLKRKSKQCPSCLKPVSKIKEYKNKKFIHKIINGKETFIIYRARRLVCPYCGKSFNEDNPFDKTYSSITNATLISILKELKHYTATYTSVAQRHGISPTTVMNIFDNHVQIKRHPLQEIICIDEFYFNRHSRYKYAFIIMGFKNKLILDIVESRRQEKLSDYFFHIPKEERNKVLYVSMDMYPFYKSIVQLYLPNATICIDSFHVLKKITDSLNSIRKRIMRRYADNKDSQEYRLLKYRYKLLLKNGDNINNEKYFFDRILGYTTSEAGVLECILSIHPDIRLAYHIKEDYRIFNNISEEDFNIEGQTRDIEKLIEAMRNSNIKEMKEAGMTIKNWKKEILNSFKWFDGRRISNGCIEGKNNYIKKILSNANGMNNFKRARNRIMYSQNQYENYVINVQETSIKRLGQPRGKYNKSK